MVKTIEKAKELLCDYRNVNQLEMKNVGGAVRRDGGSNPMEDWKVAVVINGEKKRLEKDEFERTTHLIVDFLPGTSILSLKLSEGGKDYEFTGSERDCDGTLKMVLWYTVRGTAYLLIYDSTLCPIPVMSFTESLYSTYNCGTLTDLFAIIENLIQ